MAQLEIRRTQDELPPDDDRPFAPHVGLPGRGVPVELAIDLEYHDPASWKLPLRIQVPPDSGRVPSWHLPTGGKKAETPAQAGEVELTERLRTSGRICDGFTEVLLVTDPPDAAQRGIKLDSGDQALLDGCGNHRRCESWVGLPRRRIEDSTRGRGARQPVSDDGLLWVEAPRLVHLDAAEAGHFVAAQDDQMDLLGLGRKALETRQLQRRVAAQSALARIKDRHPHQLSSVRRDVLEQHDLLAHSEPSLSPQIGIDDVGSEADGQKLPSTDDTPLGAGQIAKNR